MDAASDAKSRRIRALNNYSRMTFTGCSVMLTAAVAELDHERKAKLLQTVRKFDKFDDVNDPHHEADMAFVEMDGERYFFKFDYYDVTLSRHSPDPGNAEVTRRVLTVGRASDY